jgi:hypothetical protein
MLANIDCGVPLGDDEAAAAALLARISELLAEVDGRRMQLREALIRARDLRSGLPLPTPRIADQSDDDAA